VYIAALWTNKCFNTSSSDATRILLLRINLVYNMICLVYTILYNMPHLFKCHNFISLTIKSSDIHLLHTWEEQRLSYYGVSYYGKLKLKIKDLITTLSIVIKIIMLGKAIAELRQDPNLLATKCSMRLVRNDPKLHCLFPLVYIIVFGLRYAPRNQWWHRMWNVECGVMYRHEK
jgi:hypothetical protein